MLSEYKTLWKGVGRFWWGRTEEKNVEKKKLKKKKRKIKAWGDNTLFTMSLYISVIVYKSNTFLYFNYLLDIIIGVYGMGRTYT